MTETPQPKAPSAQAPHSDGLQYKGPAGTVNLSDRSITEVVGFGDRFVSRGLDWSGQHPILFTAVLIFLFGAYVVRRATLVKMAPMQNEYEERRRNAPRQMSLPLPRRDGE